LLNECPVPGFLPRADYLTLVILTSFSQNEIGLTVVLSDKYSPLSFIIYSQQLLRMWHFFDRGARSGKRTLFNMLLLPNDCRSVFRSELLGEGFALFEGMIQTRLSNSIKKPIGLILLSMALTAILPLSAHSETVQEALARAERYLQSPGGELPRGPDLKCDLHTVFKFYKMARQDSTATPELCDSVAAFGSHFGQNVLPYWPLQDTFGIEVQPISKLEEFNAAFMMRPILNKQTLPYFSFRYLPGAPIQPQIGVWSHEAGHAALQEILDNHFYPIAKKNFLKIIENQARNTPAEQAIKKQEAEDQAIKTAWNTATAEEINNVLSKRQSASGFRIKALQNVARFKDPLDSAIVSSFHEFFADLFAAYLHNNPNVTGDSLDQLGITTIPTDFRRFEPKSAIASAKGWQNLESHLLLTPARHYFGKNLFSRIKDPKLFMHQLAQHIIHVLENPDTSMFMSYQPTIQDVQKSQTPEQLSEALAARQKTAEIYSPFQPREFKEFCELDFAACKTEILNQLKRGQNGIFLTNVNAEIANVRLIRAMEEIVQSK
jgi:hypothetical protein